MRGATLKTDLQAAKEAKRFNRFLNCFMFSVFALALFAEPLIEAL